MLTTVLDLPVLENGRTLIFKYLVQLLLPYSIIVYIITVGENHNQRSAKPATIIIISNLCINKIRMECNSHFDTIID